MFDFVIPKSRRQPERILQTVNNPNKDAVEAVMFKWLDTKETRPENARLYVMLNDASSTCMSDSVSNAFLRYGVEPVRWSQRSQIVEPLAA
jgi:hypothetical protein